MKFFGITLMLLLPLGLWAQQSPQDEEKQFRQAIDTQIEEYTNLLDLDSIMTHDYTAMRDEIQDLSKARVSNSDVYQRVQDKWMEQMYQSFSKVFNEEQWDKYLKAGAQRDKRLRDKREAKRQQ